MRCLCRQSLRRRRGLALVLALWFSLLLMTMVYTLLWDVRVETQLQGLSNDDLEARWLARAGVAKAIADLCNDSVIQRAEPNIPVVDTNGDVWAMDNEDKTNIRLADRSGAGYFSVQVRDAEGLINLNRGRVELLRNLFIVLGEDEELEAQWRADMIIDWRDENTEPISANFEPGMQEREHWHTILLEEMDTEWDGVLHNGRFLTVEELLSLPMITPEIFYGPEIDPELDSRSSRSRRRRSDPEVGLRDCVTTLSNGTLNINTARREVLGAMALTAMGDGADWESVADAIIDYRDGSRLESSKDDHPFASVQEIQSVPSAAALLSRADQWGLTTVSQNFTITSTGHAGDAQHTIVCEVSRNWEVYVMAYDPDSNVSQFASGMPVTSGQQFLGEWDSSGRRNSNNRSRSRRGSDTTVERPAVRIMTWVEN